MRYKRISLFWGIAFHFLIGKAAFSLTQDAYLELIAEGRRFIEYQLQSQDSKEHSQLDEPIPEFKVTLTPFEQSRLLEGYKKFHRVSGPRGFDFTYEVGAIVGRLLYLAPVACFKNESVDILMDAIRDGVGSANDIAYETFFLWPKYNNFEEYDQGLYRASRVYGDRDPYPPSKPKLPGFIHFLQSLDNPLSDLHSQGKTFLTLYLKDPSVPFYDRVDHVVTYADVAAAFPIVSFALKELILEAKGNDFGAFSLQKRSQNTLRSLFNFRADEFGGQLNDFIGMAQGFLGGLTENIISEPEGKKEPNERLLKIIRIIDKSRYQTTTFINLKKSLQRAMDNEDPIHKGFLIDLSELAEETHHSIGRSILHYELESHIFKARQYHPVTQSPFWKYWCDLALSCFSSDVTQVKRLGFQGIKNLASLYDDRGTSEQWNTTKFMNAFFNKVSLGELPLLLEVTHAYYDGKDLQNLQNFLDPNACMDIASFKKSVAIPRSRLSRPQVDKHEALKFMGDLYWGVLNGRFNFASSMDALFMRSMERSLSESYDRFLPLFTEEDEYKDYLHRYIQPVVDRYKEETHASPHGSEEQEPSSYQWEEKKKKYDVRKSLSVSLSERMEEYLTNTVDWSGEQVSTVVKWAQRYPQTAKAMETVMKGGAVLLACGGPQGLTPVCWTTVGIIGVNDVGLLDGAKSVVSQGARQLLSLTEAHPENIQFVGELASGLIVDSSFLKALKGAFAAQSMGFTPEMPKICKADLSLVPVRTPPPWQQEKWVSQFWSSPKTYTFNGQANKVYQRNDLFDVKYVDPESQMSNLQLMRSGKAPIGIDKNPINLHHLIQQERGGLVEVTRKMHEEYGKVLHINPPAFGSGIDRSKFASWRKEYWKNRARDFNE